MNKRQVKMNSIQCRIHTTHICLTKYKAVYIQLPAPPQTPTTIHCTPQQGMDRYEI